MRFSSIDALRFIMRGAAGYREMDFVTKTEQCGSGCVFSPEFLRGRRRLKPGHFDGELIGPTEAGPFPSWVENQNQSQQRTDECVRPYVGEVTGSRAGAPAPHEQNTYANSRPSGWVRRCQASR